MSKRRHKHPKGTQDSRRPGMPATHAAVPVETSAPDQGKRNHSPEGRKVKSDSSDSPVQKRPPWWRPLTTWAGRVTTSVLITALGALAAYGVHLLLSSTKKPDLSGPPVKIEEIQVTPLDDDLLSGKVIHSARTADDQGLVSAIGITALIRAVGNRSGLVRIIDIQVLKTCSAPLRGTMFFVPPQGALFTVGMGFDLDNPNPVAREIHNVGATYGIQRLGASYFASQEYDLKLGEPVTLALTAQTARYFCRFSFELDLLVNGRPARQIINDEGKLFSASAEYDLREGLPDFRAYGALYTDEYTIDPCASSDKLVEENPHTWRYQPDARCPGTG
jgi:hypothetical protein